MVSAIEAGFDLRESAPLLRNILHSWEFTVPTDTEQRANPLVHLFLTDYRSWCLLGADRRFQPATCLTQLTLGIPQRAGWVRLLTATYRPLSSPSL
jgi:hypothetical protein